MTQAKADGDKNTIESFGFDFSAKEPCSEWALAKINVAIAKARG